MLVRSSAIARDFREVRRSALFQRREAREHVAARKILVTGDRDVRKAEAQYPEFDHAAERLRRQAYSVKRIASRGQFRFQCRRRGLQLFQADGLARIGHEHRQCAFLRYGQIAFDLEAANREARAFQRLCLDKTRREEENKAEVK